MLSWFARIPSRYPFSFGVGYTAFKGGTVDALIQTQAEGVPLSELDMRRNGLFTLFNATFTGAWQYFLFVKIMGRVCPGAASFAAKPFADKLKGEKTAIYFSAGSSNVAVVLCTVLAGLAKVGCTVVGCCRSLVHVFLPHNDTSKLSNLC